MAKTKIKCSCGEEFSLPKGIKGSFTCECGERYGVNEKPEKEVVVAPRPYYPLWDYRPFRPYWSGGSGGVGVTYGPTPNISSGGAANALTTSTDGLVKIHSVSSQKL